MFPIPPALTLDNTQNFTTICRGGFHAHANVRRPPITSARHHAAHHAVCGPLVLSMRTRAQATRTHGTTLVIARGYRSLVAHTGVPEFRPLAILARGRILTDRQSN